MQSASYSLNLGEVSEKIVTLLSSELLVLNTPLSNNPPPLSLSVRSEKYSNIPQGFLSRAVTVLLLLCKSL